MPIKLIFVLFAATLPLLAVLTACGGEEPRETRRRAIRTATPQAMTTPTTEPTYIESESTEDKPLLFLLTPTASAVSTSTPRPEPTATAETSSAAPQRGIHPSFYPLMRVIPEHVETVFLIDLEEVRGMQDYYPGNFGEMMEGVERDLDMEVQFDFDISDISTFAVAAEYLSEDDLVIIQGDLDFDKIPEEFNSSSTYLHLGYEIFSGTGDNVLIEEDQVVAIGHDGDTARDVVEILAGQGVALADADESPVKRLLEKLGPSPVVVATTNGGCEEAIPGCVGFGAALAGLNPDRYEAFVGVAVIFESEAAAKAANANYDMAKVLQVAIQFFMDEADNTGGVADTEEVVAQDVLSDDEFVTGEATIKLAAPGS